MPVRFEVCGLLVALSVTLNVPVLVLVLVPVVGMNVTKIVHLPMPAGVVPHVVRDRAKSPGGRDRARGRGFGLAVG